MEGPPFQLLIFWSLYFWKMDEILLPHRLLCHSPAYLRETSAEAEKKTKNIVITTTKTEKHITTSKLRRQVSVNLILLVIDWINFQCVLQRSVNVSNKYCSHILSQQAGFLSGTIGTTDNFSHNNGTKHKMWCNLWSYF